MRQLIRPNRENVIRWYLYAAVFPLWLISDEIASTVVDILVIEHGLTESLFDFSLTTVAIALVLSLVGSSMPSQEANGMSNRLFSGFRHALPAAGSVVLWAGALESVISTAWTQAIIYAISALTFTLLLVILERRVPVANS